jgi:hypothetical protein
MKKITFIRQATFGTDPSLIKDTNQKTRVKLPIPKPSLNYIPDWYKKSERWIGSDGPVIANYSTNQGLKHCVPFLEVMTSGYMIELWTDIQVTQGSDGYANLNWLSEPDPLVIRNQSSGALIPRPAGHSDTHYAWVGQFAIKVPKGYSVLLTHPVNRYDLPFTTLSGIIDSDSYQSSGMLPFFLKDNFEGIIKAGTPIAQLFPYKRDAWTSSEGNSDEEQHAIQLSFDTRRSLGGLYKKIHWTRKEYK